MSVPLPGRLIFDEPAFRAVIADRLGCDDDTKRADLLGVHISTYRRLKNGRVEPGEVVVRNLIGKFPGVDPRRVLRYDRDARRPGCE